MAKTILIVEDNELNLKVFNDILQAEGYNTLKSKDGLNILAIMEEKHPDLVLMDIKLPIYSGFEIIKNIKLNKKIIDIPVIAVTALAMSGDKQKILDAGFNDYITKPVSLKELLLTIKHLI